MFHYSIMCSIAIVSFIYSLLFAPSNALLMSKALTGASFHVGSHNGRFRLLMGAQDEGDPVSQLPIIEAELSISQDPEMRTKLQGQVDNIKMQAEFGIRRAQSTFYEAFTNKDIKAMEEVWSDASVENVRCVHPGMPAIKGKKMILESFSQIFESSQGFSITPSRTQIDISGQTALCSCIEETTGGGKLECLNVYKRESGSWKMILHMASPIVASAAFF